MITYEMLEVRFMDEDDKKLRKEAWKEAMREFLEEEKKATFESFGKWVAHTLSIILLCALVWMMIHVERLKG